MNPTTAYQRFFNRIEDWLNLGVWINDYLVPEEIDIDGVMLAMTCTCGNLGPEDDGWLCIDILKPSFRFSLFSSVESYWRKLHSIWKVLVSAADGRLFDAFSQHSPIDWIFAGGIRQRGYGSSWMTAVVVLRHQNLQTAQRIYPPPVRLRHQRPCWSREGHHRLDQAVRVFSP